MKNSFKQNSTNLYNTLWKQKTPKSRKYKKISFFERMEAIKMILEEKKSYRETNKILKISLSTLKLIISRYEETGTVF